MTFFPLARHREKDPQRDWEMLLHIRDDDAFDRRPDCGLSDLWIETREDDDDARARIGELVVELADRVQRVGRNDDGACLEASEERVDELRAVGKDEGDPVALADAEPLEAGGEPVGEVVDIPVRHRRIDAAAADGTTKYGRGGVRVLAGGLFEEGVKWQPGIGQAPGDPTVICRFPLACRLHHAHNVETRLIASHASAMPRVLILGGARTPFVRAGTEFADLDVLDLAKAATSEALARTELDPGQVDEVIFGNVARPVAYHNLAREVVLSLSMPTRIPAFTVGLACASACVAITSAADHIAGGNADVVIAGGSESLTNVLLTLTPRLARGLIAASQAKSLPAKARSLADVRASDIAPVAPGIRENSTGLTMGESAERMAAMNAVSREDQDAWALRSHTLAAAGWDDGRLAAEVGPVYLDGHPVTTDNHIRRDSTLEKLAALRPVFDREHGTITAGNASPLTDGAAAVVLASEARAQALGLEALAAVRSYAYAAVDPADQLLIAPAYAIPIALRRAGLTLDDIDVFEMHEAFAAQVLSTLVVLEQSGVGRIPDEKLNVMGGSIALGHPFGATGARIVLTLANEMRRRGARYGLATACAAGGNGAAIILERAA